LFWIPDSGWFTYPVIEGRMERINGFPVFAVGASLGAIAIGFDSVSPFPYARLVAPFTLAITSLETLVNTAVVDLPLTFGVARQMLERWRFLISPEQIQARANSDLTTEEIAEVRSTMQHFTSVLFAELPQADIYYMTQKRAYKMSLFLKEADKVLAPDVILIIEDRTKLDIQEAGRCLAYDQNTAAGFHCTRAVEAVARNYYQLIADKYATEDGTANGASIRLNKLIRELTTRYGSLGSPVDHPLGTILADLNRIRVIYRNPIMHPEMVLTEKLAIRVFNISTDVITAMVDDVVAHGPHFGTWRQNWNSKL
jgi:hypothetical protein